MIDAVRKEDFSTVVKLVDQGANINASGDPYGTPLHVIAWERGSLNIANFLLNKGANVNTKNANGSVPLGYAAYRNGFNIAKLLIERDAYVNAKDSLGQTPLHLAAAHSSLNMVQLLLDAGAEAQSKNNLDETPLDMARKSGSSDMIGFLEGISIIIHHYIMLSGRVD